MDTLTLRIGGIRYRSLQEGPGHRTVLWFAGCSLGCIGCINPHLWPRESGEAITVSQVGALLQKGIEAGDSGVTIVGGEPFDQPEALAALCQVISSTWPASTHPPRLILYSGYTLEALAVRSLAAVTTALTLADILVDGPYVAALNDPNLGYRGSSNQRVIDLKRTLVTGVIHTLNWDRPGLAITPDGAIIASPLTAQRLNLPTSQVRHCGQMTAAGGLSNESVKTRKYMEAE